MTTTGELLADGFGRVRDAARAAVDGLDVEALTHRVDPEANTVAWLVWHLARVQDDHVADVAGTEQVWTAQGWHARSGLDLEPGETGYGHEASDVAAVRLDADLLLGYLDAVVDATLAYCATLSDADLDRVVDERWDPPVTLAVRLVSVLDDDLQHVGQAALVRGLVERAAS